MVRVSRRLAGHEHHRCERERILLSALFPTIAAAACVARCLWRFLAERTPLLEKHGHCKDGFRFDTRYSPTENALAILVCPFLGRRGEKNLSRKLFRRNARLRSADRESHGTRTTRVRFWRRAGIAILCAARLGHALHFSLSTLWAVSERTRKTNRCGRGNRTRCAGNGCLCSER